jgi:hypothetical protein
MCAGSRSEEGDQDPEPYTNTDRVKEEPGGRISLEPVDSHPTPHHHKEKESGTYQFASLCSTDHEARASTRRSISLKADLNALTLPAATGSGMDQWA